MKLTYNQVARRLFHELKSVYPSSADLPFESFLKSDVGLSDTEIKGIYKMDECHFEPSEQRLKEIISCEMHQLQIYYSENFDTTEGLAKLNECLKTQVKLDDAQIAEMKENGYFNDWISDLGKEER